MINYHSRTVTSLQKDVHQNLLKYLKRYTTKNKRPVPPFTEENLKTIKNWLGNDPLILDLCCGTGESTYKLSKKNPGIKVLGVDKSLSRLERKNSFKSENRNVILLQDNIFDLIPLMHDELDNQVLEIHIYYPNPWPKNTHLKRRVHANPVAPYLFKLSKKFFLRSNWRIYLEEFSRSAEYYLGVHSSVQELENLDEYLTAFEKKYALSGQSIYDLKISL